MKLLTLRQSNYITIFEQDDTGWTRVLHLYDIAPWARCRAVRRNRAHVACRFQYDHAELILTRASREHACFVRPTRVVLRIGPQWPMLERQVRGDEGDWRWKLWKCRIGEGSGRWSSHCQAELDGKSHTAHISDCMFAYWCLSSGCHQDYEEDLRIVRALSRAP